MPPVNLALRAVFSAPQTHKELCQNYWRPCCPLKAHCESHTHSTTASRHTLFAMTPYTAYLARAPIESGRICTQRYGVRRRCGGPLAICIDRPGYVVVSVNANPTEWLRTADLRASKAYSQLYL